MSDPIDAEAHRVEVDRWHARRVAALTGPEGWLSVTGLFWLEPGENDVGSRGPVVLPGGPDRMGTVALTRDRVVARLDERSEVVDTGGQPVAGEIGRL